MKIPSYSLIVALLMACFFSLNAGAQDDATTGTIGGTVLSGTGKILSGCKIYGLMNPTDNIDQAAFRTETDRSGHFQFPPDAPEVQAVLAMHTGYAPDWLIQSFEPENPLRIFLGTGVVLQGRLESKDQGILAGEVVQLKLQSLKGNPAPALQWKTTSNNEGNFRFENLPPGEFNLALDSADYLLTDEQRVVLSASQEIPKNVTLMATPGFSVSGKVVDAESGEPLEDAIVWSVNDPAERTFKTDAEGQYTISGLPPGWHLIHVSAVDRNYVSVAKGEIQNVGYPGTMQVLIHDKDLKDMDVRLQKGCQVIGKIKDFEKMSALENLTIYLNNDRPHLSRLVRRRSTSPSEDGQFTFRGIPPGDGYYCLINMPDKGDEENDRALATARFDLDVKSSPKILNIELK